MTFLTTTPADHREPGDLSPINWDTSKPHPFHGPVEDLPRDANGKVPLYYYLSREEIVRTGALPPRPEPERRRAGAGLTEGQRHSFIDALAATGIVSGACAVAGICRMSAYRERNRPEGHAFRAAWDAATRATSRILVDTGLERAIEGVEEPVFYKGEQVGTRRRYNDRLLMFMLRVNAAAHTQSRDDARAEPAAMLDAALDRMEEEYAAGGPGATFTRVTFVTDTPAAARTVAALGTDCPPGASALQALPPGDRAAAAPR